MTLLEKIQRRNMQLTQSNHVLFTQIGHEIKLKLWADHDAQELIDKILEEEDEQYRQDIEYCKERLGQTSKDSHSSENIRWAD